MLFNSISKIFDIETSTPTTPRNMKIISIFTSVNFFIPFSSPLKTLQPKIINHIRYTAICNDKPSFICNTLEISFDITGTPKPNEVVIDAIIPKTTTMSIIFPIIPSLNFSPNIGVSVPDNFTSLVFLTYNIYPIAVTAGI